MPYMTATGRDAIRHEEDLINAFEAEEERITNVLSRKLEQLRNEKINLENTLEAEGESQVLRLVRELTALRSAQQQQQGGPSPSENQINGQGTSTSGAGGSRIPPGSDPRHPSADAMLDALRRENESLRNRLSDMERDYVRLSRLNEVYREELIEHRRRVGLSVDNLIGMSSTTHSPAESLSQPLHMRTSSAIFMNPSSFSSPPSVSSSPDFGTTYWPNRAIGATPIPINNHANSNSMTSATTAPVGLPIPRSANTHSHSQQQRRMFTSTVSSSETTSPSSSLPPSPYPSYSPLNAHTHMSSYQTQMTTPPSSTSPLPGAFGGFQPIQQQPLSYPSVPPPSLSSSLGSPTVSLSRRNSVGQGARRMSIERGGRIAETGSLIGRHRGRSISEDLEPQMEEQFE